MSAEEQEMLARISQLAGQINRRKNQQAGLSASTTPQYGGHHRGAPPYHARGNAYRVGKPNTVHRNRTLILNGPRSSDVDSGTASDASSSPSWVTKNDRHLQLINSNIYQKEAEARTKAIEQTRLQKRSQLDAYERAKLTSHFGRTVTSGGMGAANGQLVGPHRLVVQGIPFYVTRNGSKLVKVPGDPNPPSATPKMAMVGGVKFYRSKNGNLYRHGVVKAQRRAGAVRKINQPCRTFSTTGSCPKGPLCRYMHDPSRVAACKDLLQKGECPDGDACDLSHELTPERTPQCLHFAKGNCTNPACRYTHVKVSPGAPVCRAFGIYGYCEKGAQCAERHVYECPDFSNTGVCKTKGCKLPHRERASVLRKAAAGAARDGISAGDAAETADDLSSSGEDAGMADSDDVDSDEVEEFFGDDDNDPLPDPDIAGQMDFIGF